MSYKGFIRNALYRVVTSTLLILPLSYAVINNPTGWTAELRGTTASTSGRAVIGYASAASGGTMGVYGKSDSTAGKGVYGYASAASGDTSGVKGRSRSTQGKGVFGSASAASGTTFGVLGQSNSTGGRGVYGYATAPSGATFGVLGRSDSTSGTAVSGSATAASGATSGVYGQSRSTAGRGVYGWASAASGGTFGVFGRSNSTGGRGVYGLASAASGGATGVYGHSSSPEGYGVYCSGNFAVTGLKEFQIDHPLDPANKYLNHYSAEGPEPLNIYRGNVVLDSKGQGAVDLAEYFSEINRDLHYHLTPIGGAAPELHIAQEVEDNSFRIAGGSPGMKVSWMVTAVRNDLWVQKYGAPVEQEKSEEEKGKYLQPELYAKSKEMGIHYYPEPEGVEPEQEPILPTSSAY